MYTTSGENAPAPQSDVRTGTATVATYACDSVSFGPRRDPEGGYGARACMVEIQTGFGVRPRVGDRVLVLKEAWLRMILDECKTMEVRGARLREGDCWLGHRGVIKGRACIGPAVPIRSLEEWASLRANISSRATSFRTRKRGACPWLT